MNKNPLVNAFSAIAYIVTLVLGINYLIAPIQNLVPSLLGPIAGLSLFVFSAAIMGYLFLSGPIFFLIEKDYKKAKSFFLLTTTYFGVIAALVFVIVVSISLYV